MRLRPRLLRTKLQGGVMVVAARALALALIVAALLLLAADIAISLQDHDLTVRSLGQVWGIIAPASLASFKHWAKDGLPMPAPRWIYAALASWAWGVCGVLGVVIAFVFGRNHHAA